MGDVYFVVVDGRLPGTAEGVTIAELTKICEWLGMSDAINLDGGGSSTMWNRYWGVVNYPCRNKKFDHEGDRRVSSCMVVKCKK
jgi:exopolysaccharide biosynthesis protein